LKREKVREGERDRDVDIVIGESEGDLRAHYEARHQLQPR